MTCMVCGTAGMREFGPYAHCRACDYWSSSLPHDVASTAAPDSEYDLVSYEHTRRANYAAILDLLGTGGKLLEIGCADGLFLELAAARGHAVVGIEPNAKMTAGNKHAQDIRAGFFPGVLGDSRERFDVIALNCVFEHVPDAGGMIEDFKRYLAPGGRVMINVPVASGLMFKLSRAVYAAGVRYPFDRIWQKGFVSPHLHYFATGNLARLFARHGMQLVAERDLALFSLGGMYARLSLDPNIRFAQRWAALAALYAYYPASRIAPDARAYVFTVDPAGASA